MKSCVGLALFINFAISALFAAEHRGEVLFHGIPVPGATIVATHEGKKLVTSSDEQGRYSFSDMAKGTWQIEVEMFGFASTKRDVQIAASAAPVRWELTMLALHEINAAPAAPPVASPPAATAKAASIPDKAKGQKREQKVAEQLPEAPTQSAGDDLSHLANDGFLINGSVTNGGDTPFAQSAAFGNFRKGYSLYNGGLELVVGNSALDAQPFSLTGNHAAQPAYNRMNGSVNFGGPLPLKHLFKRSPFFYASYQWNRRSDANTVPALLPTAAERNGVFSHPIIDPVNGTAFADNTVPGERISAQARALMKLYPLPASDNNAGYNYQSLLLNSIHQDSVQSRLTKSLAHGSVSAHFGLQSSRTATPNLFGFTDSNRALGTNGGLNWWHNINRAWQVSAGYSFSRQITRLNPYFAARQNVSGEAGIAGNSQEPRNWGPPSLSFFSGIAGLSDGQSSLTRNQTSRVSYAVNWNGLTQHIVMGGEITRNQFNTLDEQNPRGSFSFSGGVTGDAFADFLLGIPDTASVTLGNANKYFRQTVYAAYLQDEWKVTPALSITGGLRWEYAAPVTELFDHLANLDMASDFTAAAPVLAGNHSGSLTGTRYPKSLVEPDRRAIQPRIGVAWRPLPASSMVVRSGYGLYYDTPVYQTIALQMAQQPPLSTTLSMQNSRSHPFTMENAFLASTSSSTSTFAVDPHFRMGYAQNWYLSIQQDLPLALQLSATYLGIKGTHGFQEFLPNTNPIGATSVCPSCPAGFVYLTSGANSSRQAGTIQLRRRMRSGFTATAQYTLSKSIDDASALGAQSVMGTLPVAQDWRNLKAERSLSSFDQRHLFTFQMQYSTGMGVMGGMLLRGWVGAVVRQWTLSSRLSAGSGLPQSPIYMATLAGTGIAGTIRPDYTGAAIDTAPNGLHLNPAAFTAPKPGAWGTAGRNSITGPGQFSLNASLARSFRLRDKYNLDFRADATNLLNHVTYTVWNTSINNSQFGLPAAANTMRSIQTTLRVRF